MSIFFTVQYNKVQFSTEFVWREIMQRGLAQNVETVGIIG